MAAKRSNSKSSSSVKKSPGKKASKASAKSGAKPSASKAAKPAAKKASKAAAKPAAKKASKAAKPAAKKASKAAAKPAAKKASKAAAKPAAKKAAAKRAAKSAAKPEQAAAAKPVKSKPAAKAKAKAPAKSAKAAATEQPAAKARLAKAPAPKEAAKKSAKPSATPAPAPAEAAASAAETTSLAVGDAAPAFELPDQDGNLLSSASLAGAPYIIYFYPKDDTPGCTKEACGFQAEKPAFESAGVRVIGVSPDSPASHTRFRAKYGLEFTLLSDADKSLAQAYGVWVMKQNYGRQYMGIQRSTFLVDGAGVISRVWRNVKVNGHVEAVLGASRG